MKIQPAILFSICTALLAGCSPSTDLDREIAAVDTQLEKLPNLQPNTLCPTVGFGSALVPEPDHTTWLDIILPEPQKFDTIVLIPALLKNKAGELETFGFPQRFTIETWLEETPGTQHASIGPGGWIYQALGTYDPAKQPHELTCTLALNHNFDGAGAGEISVSLYYANEFEAANGLDLHTATGVTQVGQTHAHPSWAQWSATTGRQEPHTVSSRFDLSSVPVGATLFLRIANQTPKDRAPVDDIKLNPPFSLTNGDFETPELQDSHKNQDIPGWYEASHTSQKWVVAHQGAHWAGAAYSKGRVVVDHSQHDFPNPGTAPVVFSLPPGTMAKKVRIRATLLQQEMSWRRNSKVYNFALNEVLLFDGMQNVALNCLASSADAENFPLMFRSAYAVDGYSYFPPINPMEVSSPDNETIEAPPILFFDLSQTCTLDEIRLYPVDRSPQFSHVYAMGIGFPHKITLRISDQPDPNTARTVLNITTVHQIGADPLMLRLNQDSGRYVWLEMSKGQYDLRTGEDALGLSEIELLQKGTNVLAGVWPLLHGETQRKLQHLTDGLSSSGIIMPQKEWLLKLHRRALLEQDKASLLLQQEQWVAKQRRLMRYLKGALLAVLLAALFIALLIRSRHRHKLRQLREKIGANLHDEVGANLSSIAISSELLTHVDELSTHQARQLIDDITRVAQETATEIRLLSRFLEKRGVESNLIGQLRRIEQQMLTGLHSRADLGATAQFNALTPTDKWELVLFFKEALNNTVKHAQATRVRICTRADAKQLYLEISDNGQGMPENHTPPIHLAKRAKKLHAQLEISSSKNEGTTLRLCIPKKRRHKK